MQVMPGGTMDPTPYIYDSSLYALSALCLSAGVVNMFIKPVKKELFEIDPVVS
jgi:hypothetical protein